MVTVAVAAIALMIAIPGFTNIIISNRLSTTANELVGSIALARMQAIKRNTPTQFCSNDGLTNGSDTLGLACGTSTGAVVTIDSSSATTQISRALDLAPAIDINSTRDMVALRYAGNGLATTPTGNAPYTGLVADIHSLQITQNNHRCIYLITGSSVSSCKYTASSGGCPLNEPTNCQQ